jgi:hypothetical protein
MRKLFFAVLFAAMTLAATAVQVAADGHGGGCC